MIWQEIDVRRESHHIFIPWTGPWCNFLGRKVCFGPIGLLNFGVFLVLDSSVNLPLSIDGFA